MKHVEIGNRTHEALYNECWHFRPVHEQWEQGGQHRSEAQLAARVSEILSAQGFDQTGADIEAAMPSLRLRWTRVRHDRQGLQRLL